MTRGAQGLAAWIKEQKRLLVTDTTFRDAHQSLLATRMRTYDMLQIAEATAKLAPQLFSLEMWGGATFDTAMRLISKVPGSAWRGCASSSPTSAFRCCLGPPTPSATPTTRTTSYRSLSKRRPPAGIDIFRIFDSLNWAEGMRVAMDAVNEAGKVVEAAICYTGDILDPTRDKYTLKYYVELAKTLESYGAHILGIKDMAGLLSLTPPTR